MGCFLTAFILSCTSYRSTADLNIFSLFLSSYSCVSCPVLWFRPVLLTHPVRLQSAS